jgi:hypothetical protein
MTSQFLPAHVDNALVENADLVPLLASHRMGLDEVLAFCRNFRVAGIGSLFLSGQGDACCRRLAQSGRAFAHWLERAPEESKVSGLSLPFFDAVAAGDAAGAAGIARLSRRTWARGEEYEEDFLFLEYLMQRFYLHAPAERRSELLSRWEAALQGADDPRLDVSRAIEERDAARFNESLSCFLTDREDDLMARFRDGGLEPRVADTEMNFSVEGVALARLADALGIATEPDYLHVPSAVRETAVTSIVADVWRKV